MADVVVHRLVKGSHAAARGQGRANARQRHPVDLGVDGRGGQRRLAQHLAHFGQRDAGMKHGGSRTVTKPVGAHRGQTSALQALLTVWVTADEVMA